MKTSTLPIDRVTADLDADDGYYHVVNPYHPRFHVVVRHAVAEFDRREKDPDKAVLKITITGQRYRSMADGSMKPVGPGAGKDTTEQTTWRFTGRELTREADLVKLARRMHQERAVV